MRRCFNFIFLIVFHFFFETVRVGQRFCCVSLNHDHSSRLDRNALESKVETNPIKHMLSTHIKIA